MPMVSAANYQRWSVGIHRSAKLVGIAILAMTGLAADRWVINGALGRSDLWSIGLLGLLLLALWIADRAIRPAG